MKFLKFNISEAYDGVLYSFQGGRSASEKLANTAKLIGKSAANIGMFAAEVAVDILKNLPESMGEKAQSTLDKDASALTEKQRERLQKQVETSKEAKAKRLASEREERDKKGKDNWTTAETIKMKKIMMVFLSSTMFFGCGKIEPQIAKLKDLSKKDSPAITQDEAAYRKPKLSFEKTALFEEMRTSGIEDFNLEGIQSYLETPENYWESCVNGYADVSKQSGGYGEAEAQRYGEQVCKNKTNALYACLNDISIKSAVSCLKKDIEEEENEGGNEANASASTPATSPAPNVDACVEQRINAFRKEQGEESLIKYDIIEEWEAECKALAQ